MHGVARTPSESLRPPSQLRLTIRDTARPQMSLPSVSLGASARYFPARLAIRARNAPESFVRIVAIVRHMPDTRRWIRTLTSW